MADQLSKDGYLCVIATKEKGEETVLGTVDFNSRTGIVNNVYVRKEARKRGIARSMMLAVEDYCHNKKGGGGRKEEENRKLKLTVMSRNVPAVTLYKNLGYMAPGIYGMLDRLSMLTGVLDFLIEMEKEI